MFFRLIFLLLFALEVKSQDCAAGTYSRLPSQPSQPCVPCPAGYFCTGSAALPIACSPGEYSSAGQSSCTACELNHICPTGHAESKQSCPTGYIPNSVKTHCVYNPVKLDSVECASKEGYYISGTSCLECPAGSYCVDANLPHIKCPEGTFSLAGSAKCDLCPAGKACSNGVVGADCTPGSYSLLGSSSCTPCPKGKYCPYIDRPVERDCDSGKYASSEGQATCDSCPINKECIDKIHAVDCVDHYYSLLGWGRCRPCPAGKRCVKSGTTDRLSAPENCPNGYYSIEGDWNCHECPAGTYCREGASFPTLCDPGTFQPARGQSLCLNCLEGKYSLRGALECIDCPEGSYCPLPRSIPLPCGLGTYSHSKAKACKKCDDGYVCISGSKDPKTDECPRGYYCTYASGKLEMLPCPAGKYGTIEGAVLEEDGCAPCPAGYFCPFEGMNVPILCLAGGYCPSGAVLPTLCPDTKFNPNKGSSDNKCKSCPAGNYCPLGTSEPLPCLAGHYCPADSGAIEPNRPKACPAGRYSSNPAASKEADCIVCPSGYYCKSGASAPEPCPAGTYNTLPGGSSLTDCIKCDAGVSCPGVGVNTKGSEVQCQPGFYCSASSANPKGEPCPKNTYSDKYGLEKKEECQKCPAGYECGEGTNRYTRPMNKCRPGHYCLEGKEAEKCPGGTYQPYYGATDDSWCSFKCPPGKYCPKGSAAPEGDCKIGYYCPEGSENKQQVECPPGTYGIAEGYMSLEECLPCPPGRVCAGKDELPVLCEEGTYNPHWGRSVKDKCILCKEGYKCPSKGMIDPQMCGYGRYSEEGALECTICPATRHCSSLTTTKKDLEKFLCEPGFLCRNGTGKYPAKKLLCNEGFFCTGQLIVGEPCPPGTYYPLKGAKKLADCIPTPAGKYSLRGSARPTGDCEPGFYCPQGSFMPQQIGCPVGTFRSLPGGAKKEDCGDCPAGYYCPLGTKDPRPCPIGYFCEPKCGEPIKCPYGTFGASPLLRDKSHCTDCWSGRFCSVPGLTAPDGRCDPGFFCKSKATVPNPMDDPTDPTDPTRVGGLCTAGGICPVGSKTPQPCPPGTYIPTEGGKSEADCIKCPGKYYCIGEVRNTWTGPCAPGYYCPPGSKTQYEKAAEPGFYSPGEVEEPIMCAKGYYSINEGSSSCTPCPAGYYCKQDPIKGNSGQIEDCTEGHYCKEASEEPEPCPKGTYSPTKNLHKESECLPCPPGKYCEEAGKSIPTADCRAGYYCDGSSSSPEQHECIKGAYCPSGSAHPILCPIGTFNPDKRSTSENACRGCTEGSYCGKTGLDDPEKKCDEGYFCSGRDTSPRPTGKRCKKGQMCPIGSSAPIDCEEGSYQDSVAQGGCIPCPRGFHCPPKCIGFTITCGQLPDDCVADSTTITDCKAGHFCKEGELAIPCPEGTYNSKTNAFTQEQCLPCDPGHFCSKRGGIATEGLCDGGYYCTRGATTKRPNGNGDGGGECKRGHYCPEGASYPIPCTPGKACTEDGLITPDETCASGHYCEGGTTSAKPELASQRGGKCEPGYYCEEGSARMTPCPAGTYNPEPGGRSIKDCLICKDGSYCANPGSSAVTGKCKAGYYCKVDTGAEVGYTTPHPPERICPKGHYCQEGATDKMPCANTDYQDLEGQSECKPCPAGFKCTDRSITLCDPKTDNKAYYCPERKREIELCPEGTYNYQERTTKLEDCLSCPAGKFCNPDSSTSQINDCIAGTYCPEGSKNGLPCTAGHYCPAGVGEQIGCPPGFYCDTDELADYASNPCHEGKYCGFKTISPTTPCPRGHYCPKGTLEPIACPPGTYNPARGGVRLSDCKECDEAKYCDSRGRKTITEECPPGYYCELGTAQGTKKPCQPGYMCPEGSSRMEPCPVGSYQPLPAQESCRSCPARFLCEPVDTPIIIGAIEPVICEAGYYCPQGSDKKKCPLGTYSEMTGLANAEECSPCPVGRSCTAEGLTTPNEKCDPGYYCKQGAKSPNTVEPGSVEECDQGYYCDGISLIPIPCPPGTFNDDTKANSAANCKPCPQGFYCPYRGGTTEMYKFNTNNEFKCAPGYLCLKGATTPTPKDGNTGRPCDIGKYCLKGALVEEDCPINTYNPYLGQGECHKCPLGKNCPRTGMAGYELCILGHYCEEGKGPKPCPRGTYGPRQDLEKDTDCYPCKPGMYCLGGKDDADGFCDPGYVCPVGAQYSINQNLKFHFNKFEKEGLCPPGHYCDGGSKAPTPCPIGEYQDEYGKIACKPCPQGRYCDRIGIVDPSPYKCAEGHLCISGAKVRAPIDPGTEGGRPCDRGHYCPEGTIVEIPCDPGSYEPRFGAKSSCQTCPAGYYCLGGVSMPEPCTAEHFCVEGTINPVRCLPGTYSNVLGLQKASQCRFCPSGKWCDDGKILGDCDAGFYCAAGAAKSDGSGQNGDPNPMKCPIGRYCPAGCLSPKVCHEGKFRLEPGAKSEDECTDCDAGFYCIAGNPEPYECPKGHYCPSKSDLPTPCPAGYYLNQKKARSIDECKACPAVGYDCTEEAVADLNNVKCPIGYYCDDSTRSPKVCPEKTYGNEYGLKSLSECKECREGFYCLEGTVTPILCDEGMMCPPGSSEQEECPEGYYCSYWNVDGYSIARERVCPAGFYCPKKTVIPISCDNGFYCPEGSAEPTPCPPGSMGMGSTHSQSVETGCITCPPGTYSLISPRGGSTACLVCPAGYVCVSSTSTSTPIDPEKDGGYECPRGYYCPEGSYEPTPCPIGHFNKDKLVNSSDYCYPCEANTYADVPGQSGCKPCGPTSISEMGSTICKCRGNNRVFQMANGKCVCKQYYTSVLENDEDDSNYDCRPLLHDRCPSEKLRGSLGHCLSQDDCEDECRGGTGKRTPGIGLCECNTIQDPDTVCDYQCRQDATRITVKQNGYIEFDDGSIIDMKKLEKTFGEPTCEKGHCNVLSVEMANKKGFVGIYGPSQQLVDAARVLEGISEEQAKRMLQSSVAGIDNPIICINFGDTLAFSVTSESYPIYLKDAMVNSNPEFDYTKFTELSVALKDGEDITLFLHTFTQAGIYVFGDAADLSQQLVISVMGTSERCRDEDKNIVPITLSNLLKIGIIQNEDITLSPDWLFIGAFFVIILILIPGIVMFISYLHNLSLGNKTLASISFGKKPEQAKAAATAKVYPIGMNAGKDDEADENNNNKHVIDLKEENEGGEIDPGIFDDIYQKLKDHAAYVKAECEKKFEQDKENITKVWEEMRILRKFIKMKLKLLAKIFGKNIKYMISDAKPKKKKEEVKKELIAPKEEEDDMDIFEDEGDNVEADNIMFKEAMDTRLADDAQELIKMKEKNDTSTHDFMNKFVSQENKRLEEFKERILESSSLTETDKNALMKEYENQLQKLQKQLLFDQSEGNNHLKYYLEEKKARRERLLEQKRALDNEKNQVNKKTNKLLEEVNNALKRDEKSIEAEFNANIKASKKEREVKQADEVDKLRVKFDKLLKKTSSAQKRVEIMDDYRRESKELEEAHEKERNEQHAELLEKLERRKKERKEEVRQRRKEERDGIILQCQKELDQIKEREGVIYNKLVNVAIEEKVREAKDRVAPEVEEDEKKLNTLKRQQEKELAIIEQKEKSIFRTLAEEEAKDNAEIKGDIEKRKAKLIIKTKKDCATLNERRKNIMKELDSPQILEEKKDELQKELKNIDDKIAGRIEAELLKQDKELSRMLDARRRKRIAQEIDMKRGLNQEMLELDGKCIDQEEELKGEIAERNFKRAVAELKGRMSPEEYPVALEKLLEEKHMNQLSNLLSVQYKKKAKIMSTKMGELINQKLMEMHKVKEDLEKDYNKIKDAKDTDSISLADYERRIKDAQERERHLLRNIELEYIQKGNDLEEEICKNTGERNQRELLRLRKKQLNEKNGYLAELAGTNRYAQAMLKSEPKDLIEKELEEYRNQLEEEQHKKIREFEARKQRLNDLAMETEGNLENFEEETKRLLDELARREKDKLKKKRAELEKEKEKREASLKGLSEADKEKLLQEHNEQIKKMEELMEAEQKRQSEKMMKKLEDRWKAKEKLNNQKDLQLLMYRKEVDGKLDNQLEDMKMILDVKVEVADVGQKLDMLTSKTDALRNVFYKKKFLAGAEVAKDFDKVDTKLLLERDLKEDDDEFTGTLLNIDFDKLLANIDGMKEHVSVFTDKDFTQLIRGFRIINTQLNELRSKALGKK